MTHWILVDNIRRTLQRNAFVYIDSVTFRSLLIWQGAEQEDLNKIEAGTFHDAVAKDAEPSMAYRQIIFHRLVSGPECDVLQQFQNANGPAENWQQCQREEKNLCFLRKRAKKLYSKECRG